MFASGKRVVGITFLSQFCVTRSQPQPVSPTSYSRINFNIELYDNNSEYDNVTNYRWTPEKAGIYSIGCHVEIKNITDTKIAYADIVKNGSDIIIKDFHHSGGIESLMLEPIGDIKVEEGDYFEVMVYHNDTDERQLGTYDSCLFWAHRIA